MFSIYILFFLFLVIVSEIILFFRWRIKLSRSWFNLRPGQLSAILTVYICLCIVAWQTLLARIPWAWHSDILNFDGSLRPVYYAILAWHYGLFLTFPFYITILGLIKIRNSRRTVISDPQGMDRREFLAKTGSLATDSMAAVAGLTLVSSMFLGSRQIVTKKTDFKINDLHPDLAGLRIAQISDLHISHLINDNYLEKVAVILKEIKADVLVVTGDIIDSSNYYLPAAGRFFAAITPNFKHGAFGVTGNHDSIDELEPMTKVMNSAGLRMLRNQSQLVQRGDGRLNITGIDYPEIWRLKTVESKGAGEKRRHFARMYYQAAARTQVKGLPTIVLNHHPDDFDWLSKKNIDLVLSGHTHGGQVRISEDHDSIANPGSWAYKYYSGRYENNGRALYVNDGLGHWMPLRINCPPEISVIELV